MDGKTRAATISADATHRPTRVPPFRADIARALRYLDEVRRKIRDLQKIEHMLRGMAAKCRGGTVPECPIVHALFEDRR